MFEELAWEAIDVAVRRRRAGRDPRQGGRGARTRAGTAACWRSFRLSRQDVVVNRYCVVGNSGAGKTHLARRLAAQLRLPHVELDGINHRPGWQEAPAAEFRSEVTSLLSSHEATRGGWVVDGNYRSKLEDVLQPDTYVWLDYPRRIVFPRVLRRTLGRLLLRRELWNGNRERWRSLVQRDPAENIVLWSWVNQSAYRRRYEQLSADDGHATWVRLSSPRDTERWLSDQPR